MLAAVAGCSGEAGGGGASATGTGGTGAGPGSATATTGGATRGSGSGATGDATAASGTATAGDTGASGTGGCPGICFDVGAATGGIDMGTPPPSCKVVDGMDAVGDCTEKAPPDAFEPETQWDFTGPPGYSWSIATPLVANLTDDNDDGEIDLCDVPDVVVVAGPEVVSDVSPSRLYVLDGQTGMPHFFADQEVQLAATPAIGDIDGDQIPEIVTVGPGGPAPLVAFEHDGTVKWVSNATWTSAQSSAVALADVDADGDVEIVAGANLFDHQGNLLWSKPGDEIYSASVAADLDGDGQLEILTAIGVFRADGSTYFGYPPQVTGWAHPQVADLDDDGLPEVLLATNSGFMLFEHDGTLVYGPLAPTGATYDWNRPINIHNMDGDPSVEFGAADPSHYAIYDGDGSIVWQTSVVDSSGQAGGTAFDFIGKGAAQAIYADEQTVWVYDEQGNVLMSVPHLSGTVIEYPTVADIDNDGSAEMLVVSNAFWWGTPVPFTVRAIRDVQDRWVQGRRIWNQHTYHVTNVREDGTIPQFEPKHWELLNTFRTQAQIENGGLCKPKPEG